MMLSAKQKISNIASAAKERITICTAKAEEHADKATAATSEEREIAKERRKAKEARAKMELHEAKARHAAEKLNARKHHYGGAVGAATTTTATHGGGAFGHQYHDPTAVTAMSGAAAVAPGAPAMTGAPMTARQYPGTVPVATQQYPAGPGHNYV